MTSLQRSSPPARAALSVSVWFGLVVTGLIALGGHWIARPLAGALGQERIERLASAWIGLSEGSVTGTALVLVLALAVVVMWLVRSARVVAADPGLPLPARD